MIIEAISKLIKEVMEELMTGKATPSQTAAYLTALHMKGETIEEITASAIGMRNQCTRLEPSYDTLEIVGTGGDCAQSINISTTAALIVAATGNKVTKHGNRAASSKCGAEKKLKFQQFLIYWDLWQIRHLQHYSFLVYIQKIYLYHLQKLFQISELNEAW